MMHPASMTEAALLESFNAIPHVSGEPRFEALRHEMKRREGNAWIVGLSAFALLAGAIGAFNLL